jgi:hypothetical protein
MSVSLVVSRLNGTSLADEEDAEAGELTGSTSRKDR